MNLDINSTGTTACTTSCPVCGHELYNYGKGNKDCLICGYRESVLPYLSNSQHVSSDSNGSAEINNTPDTPGLYGWICPKCGAVMSPYTDFCPNCTRRDFNISFSTSATNTVHTEGLNEN